VVASAVGGHTDTVVDGVTGVLVPPRQPDVLTRVIRDLLAGGKLPAFRSAAAERARARYPWERISQETIAAYERICHRRGAAASQPSRAPQRSGAGQ
jgi:glycosyltransferase involved in cell wall biosynthesis